MLQGAAVIPYLANLSNGKLVLWCYLIWWASTVVHHFDPAPSIWLNSLGISAFIGVALILSVGGLSSAAANKWQTFRLFAMPFGVSSFSSLIKGEGFILIFSPSPSELITTAGLCVAFTAGVLGLRRRHHAESLAARHEPGHLQGAPADAGEAGARSGRPAMHWLLAILAAVMMAGALVGCFYAAFGSIAIYMVATGRAAPGEPMYLDVAAPSLFESTIEVGIGVTLIVSGWAVRSYVERLISAKERIQAPPVNGH